MRCPVYDPMCPPQFGAERTPDLSLKENLTAFSNIKKIPPDSHGGVLDAGESPQRTFQGSARGTHAAATNALSFLKEANIL